MKTVRQPVALDVGRVHPTTRIGAPMPAPSSPPTPSSLRSATTVSSSAQSSPQQQQQQQQQQQAQQQQQQVHHPPSIAAVATAALANGTVPNAASSTSAAGGGGAPPPSRQSEPKDLKYRDTTPSAKKKVTVLIGTARTHVIPQARDVRPFFLFLSRSLTRSITCLIFFCIH